MYKKYMIVCEVFSYFIFGMYCLSFNLGTANISAPGPKKPKAKK